MMKPSSNINSNNLINKNKNSNGSHRFINTNNLNDKPTLDMFRTPNAAVFTNAEYHNMLRQNSAPKSLTKFHSKNNKLLDQKLQGK